MITKPMLAQTADDLRAIKFPVLATPKLDGIRCLKVDGKILSRKFKEIPNHHVRKTLSEAPDGFDGEIICPGKTFNETQSLIMTEEGEPQFVFIVFDYVQADLKRPYHERIRDLEAYFKHFDEFPHMEPLFPLLITNYEDLMKYEESCVNDGFEGVMIRTPDSPYKLGRSTVKEGYLLKIKRFQDDEAEIIGFEERLQNNNEKTTNELGYAKRSSHKANLIPAGTLGTLLVRDIKTGVEFGIGTGFDDATRLEIWNNRENFLGAVLTYQHQPSGQKDKPRFPSFKGFRSLDDMSEG